MTQNPGEYNIFLNIWAVFTKIMSRMYLGILIRSNGHGRRRHNRRRKPNKFHLVFPDWYLLMNVHVCWKSHVTEASEQLKNCKIAGANFFLFLSLFIPSLLSLRSMPPKHSYRGSCKILWARPVRSGETGAKLQPTYDLVHILAKKEQLAVATVLWIFLKMNAQQHIHDVICSVYAVYSMFSENCLCITPLSLLVFWYQFAGILPTCSDKWPTLLLFNVT